MDCKLVCDYLRPAHTEDGIVVWIPKDKVLFGGNEVRRPGGRYGNIGDATLKEWSDTIFKVKEIYGTAKIVVPGHGRYGGVELPDYTIGLYKPSKWGNVLKMHNVGVLPVFTDYDDIFEIAQSDSIAGNKRYLKEAVVFVNHSRKHLKVASPQIVHRVDEKMISSDAGRLQIFNKETNVLIEYLYYKAIRPFKNG